MILDNLAVLSDSQAITATAASTNVYDLGAPGKTGYNGVQLKRNLRVPKVPLLVQVVEAFNNLTSLTIAVQQSDDNSSFSDVVGQVHVIPLASLVKGFILPQELLLRGVTKRYIRLNYTVTGTAPTTGKVFAGFVGAVDASYQG